MDDECRVLRLRVIRARRSVHAYLRGLAVVPSTRFPEEIADGALEQIERDVMELGDRRLGGAVPATAWRPFWSSAKKLWTRENRTREDHWRFVEGELGRTAAFLAALPEPDAVSSQTAASSSGPAHRAAPTQPPARTGEPTPLTMQSLRSLRRVLAQLYSRPDSVSAIVGDAGLDGTRVSLQGSADAMWRSVLAEAVKVGNGAVWDVIEIAIDEYGSNGELGAAVDELRLAIERKVT